MSYFFGEPWLDGLRQVLPELLDRARARRIFRVWNADCGKGEDLHSIAILLAELLPDADDWSLFLTGTDSDESKLIRARRAVYPGHALAAKTRDEHAVYFRYDAVSGRYTLRDRYRLRTYFTRHALDDAHAAPPAPGRFDLIVSRDHLAHFTADEQDAALAKFERALTDRGTWISGTRDPVPGGAYATWIYPGMRVHRRGEASLLPTARARSELPTVRPPSSMTVPTGSPFDDAVPSSLRRAV
jgi:chemotaxis protein methyltransferase CheR